MGLKQATKISNHFLTSTSNEIDQDLGGGITLGDIYLLHGGEGTGKSRFARVVTYGSIMGIAKDTLDETYSDKYRVINEHLDQLRNKDSNYKTLTRVFYFAYENRPKEVIRRMQHDGIQDAPFLVISGFLSVYFQYGFDPNADNKQRYLKKALLSKINQAPPESLIIIDSINTLIEGDQKLSIEERKNFIHYLKEIVEEKNLAVFMLLRSSDKKNVVVDKSVDNLEGFEYCDWIIECQNMAVGSDIVNTLVIRKSPQTAVKRIYWDVREGVLSKISYNVIAYE
ncbi:MAG: hypothetical protein INQ03_15805 [Candidatus Heimdallarchaeota archaeon]|nr:hypothetical protein [Candidatus Heimdallarchaeota archaeon]